MIVCPLTSRSAIVDEQQPGGDDVGYPSDAERRQQDEDDQQDELEPEAAESGPTFRLERLALVLDRLRDDRPGRSVRTRGGWRRDRGRRRGRASLRGRTRGPRLGAGGDGRIGVVGHGRQRYGTRAASAACALATHYHPGDAGSPAAEPARRPSFRGVALRLAPRAGPHRHRRRGGVAHRPRGARDGRLADRPRLPVRRGPPALHGDADGIRRATRPVLSQRSGRRHLAAGPRRRSGTDPGPGPAPTEPRRRPRSSTSSAAGWRRTSSTPGIRER